MRDETLEDLSSLSGTSAPGEQFYRRAGARLAAPPAPSVNRVSQSPAALHAGYHAFDLAHALMLREQGLLPPDVGRRMLEGLLTLEDETGDPVPARESIGRGAHSGEAHLIDKYGEAVGGWLHTGRSSHDLSAVATRYVLRDRLLTVGSSLVDLIETYAVRAGSYTAVPMPTYTGLQRAQVGTIGYRLCSQAFPLTRDLGRLITCYDRLNRSPAGAAAGTTTDFAIDRERVASLLGFDDVLQNAEDIDKSVDHLLEVGFTIATSAATVGRAADTFFLWFSDEWEIVDLPDELCGTSSIMPQKKNPHSIQAVQRGTNELIGEAIQQFIAVKNLSGGVQYDPALLRRFTETLDTLRAVVDGATFDTDRARALVAADWALATDLAALLTKQCGIPWRSAHQIVAVLVREYKATDRSLTNVAAADLETIAEAYLGDRPTVPTTALETLCDPAQAPARRAGIIGSPAPEQVADQLETLRTRAEMYRDQLTERRVALDHAHATRRSDIRSVLDA